MVKPRNWVVGVWGVLMVFGCRLGADTPAEPAPKVRINSQSPQEQAESQAGHYFLMAEALSAEGKTEEAIKYYDLAVKTDPKAATLYFKKALAHERMQQWDLAVVAVENALQLDPKNVEYLVGQARILAQKGDANGAEAAVEKAFKLQPKNQDVMYLVGVSSFEKEKYDRALQIFSQLLKSDEDYPLAYLMVAEIHRKKNQPQKAIKILEQALERYPRFTQVASALGVMLESVDSKRAYAFYKSYFARNPEDKTPQTLARYAEMALAKNDFEVAEPLLQQIFSQDEENLNVGIRLGLIQAELKKWQEAEVTFTKLQKAAPEADRVAFYLGLIYDEQGKSDLALAQYAKVVEPSEHFSQAKLRETVIMKSKLEAKPAREYVEKRYKEFPEQAGYALMVAAMVEESEGVEASINFLKAEDSKFPTEERLKIQIASLYDKLGRTGDGIPFMEKLLVKNPQSAFAHNYIGYTLLEQGQLNPKVIRHITEAYRISPADPFIMDSYGWMLFHQKKYKQARQVLEMASSLKPSEGILWEHLAEVYRALKLVDLAEQSFKRARDLYQETASKDQVVAGRLKTIEEKLAQLEKLRLPASSPRQTLNP